MDGRVKPGHDGWSERSHDSARRLLRRPRRQDRRRRHPSGNDNPSGASPRSAGPMDAAQDRNTRSRTGFAISIAASARSGCGSRGCRCRTLTSPRSFNRRWSKCMRWSRTAATKACWSLIFASHGQCELTFFGVTAKLIGSGAGRWLMNRALERAWSRQVARVWVHTCTLDHPAVRWRSISARGFARSGGRSRLRMIRGWMGQCRGMSRSMCRSLSERRTHAHQPSSPGLTR